MDRDRDATGRPRNARPRDGLGRPLPYDAAGVPRQSEGVIRTPEQTLQEAQDLLDAGRPFHAHEVFEDAWKAARDAPTASLWKALAQLAVGCTHRLRGNAVGAERLLHRAAVGLAPHAPTAPYDINVAALLNWAQQPQDRVMPRLQTHPHADTPTDARHVHDSGPESQGLADGSAVTDDRGMRRMLAKVAHEIPDRPPLQLSVGQRVDVGDRDTEWPEFVFVTAAQGSGWVPARHLSAPSGSAVVLTEYDTTELPTHVGEVLDVVAEDPVSGWVWCRSEEGREGWVPMKTLDAGI